MEYPKLRSSVSVVKLSDIVLEFFLINTRQQVRLKVHDDTILQIVCSLDGTKSISDIAKEFELPTEQYNELEDLCAFLKKKSILSTIGSLKDTDDYRQFRRIITFLEDYSDCEQTLQNMWNNIRNSTVAIIGLGAVGTWIAFNLVQSGVKNFVLIDPDTVDITNIHRQVGFFEEDIGKEKADVIEQRLKDMSEEIHIIKIKEFLDESMLEKSIPCHLDLIINCADKPNVDLTSLWIGAYCMKHRIPHIIGGGYNMHLSLIGQTVIPYQTACVKCFETQLAKSNTIDTTKIKKLNIKNRKIGSYGPMCSIIASITGMEAFKVLSKRIAPANVNRRGEFNIYDMSIKYTNFRRDPQCKWCGVKNDM